MKGEQTSPGGMIPEQVWDASNIPEHGLENGHPSGSGMPLVWAHSEYLKLIRSLDDGVVFDTPTQTVDRYIKTKTISPLVIWRFNHQVKRLPSGKTLRIETLVPAQLRCSLDGWESFTEYITLDTGFGLHFVDLASKRLPAGGAIDFTFYWPDAQKWEGENFQVKVQ
jgi:glucoamylase